MVANVFRRNGEGVQVTYEHRPSDEQEVQRIKDAKGWVVRNRVAGKKLPGGGK